MGIKEENVISIEMDERSTVVLQLPVVLAVMAVEAAAAALVEVDAVMME